MKTPHRVDIARRLRQTPPLVIRFFDSARVVAVAASMVSCTPRLQWDTKLAPGFTASGHTVSVFGVYKDGQMSPEAWDALRPRLEPLLGGRACEIARGDSLAQDESPVLAAVDEYARTNGPTDDLLAQLGPAARGDLILVVVEAGNLPPPDPKATVVDSPGPAGPSAQGSSGSNSSGLSTFAPKRHSGAKNQDVLQLSASLFSVSQGRSVALVDLQYSGESVDEAIAEFAARVGRLFPGTTCAGWNWQANVDPERIRKLVEQ